MPLKRPRLMKREEAAAPAPAQSYSPAPSGQPTSATGTRGITTQELQAVLGGTYTAPTAGQGKGVTVSDLGHILGSSAPSTGENRSVESARVTSYPGDRDLKSLPDKAGMRTGPRVTSYRVGIRRAAHSNVYDTIT
ncbi:MAG: hypothetical protein M3164_08245 [Actinomycetota bacterium]|nr:hypothetical protein [Actinomycetota bacterium]